MNPHAEHQAAQMALPWLLKGTLEPAERARVDGHLLTCAACRADLANLALIGGAATPAAPACDPDRALARLAPLLDESRQQAGRVAGPNAHAAANDSRWLRTLLLAQCAAIAVLLALLLGPAPAGDTYLALGADSRPGADVAVRFAPDTPERELRRIVQAGGARIVDGPLDSGAYLLSVPRPRIGATLARMRAEPMVRLVEPLAGEPRP